MARDPFTMKFGSMDPGGSRNYGEGDPPPLPQRRSGTMSDSPQYLAPWANHSIPIHSPPLSPQYSPTITDPSLSSIFRGADYKQSAVSQREIHLGTQATAAKKEHASIGSILRRAVKAALPSDVEFTQLPTQSTVERQSNVIVNGVQLGTTELSSLQQLVGTVLPGSYWYDHRSGAYGFIGQPCGGVIAAGLYLGGGQLARNASGSTGTGCYINGRELHRVDIMGLQGMGFTNLQGNWWLNVDGSYGAVGSFVRLGNLRLQNLASATSGRGGVNSWSTNMGHYGGSDGQGFTYIRGPGWSWSS